MESSVLFMPAMRNRFFVDKNRLAQDIDDTIAVSRLNHPIIPEKDWPALLLSISRNAIGDDSWNITGDCDV